MKLRQLSPCFLQKPGCFHGFESVLLQVDEINILGWIMAYIFRGLIDGKLRLSQWYQNRIVILYPVYRPGAQPHDHPQKPVLPLDTGRPAQQIMRESHAWKGRQKVFPCPGAYYFLDQDAHLFTSVKQPPFQPVLYRIRVVHGWIHFQYCIL